jgi:ribokinase
MSREYATGISVVLLDDNAENRIIRGESASRYMDASDLELFRANLPEYGIFVTQLSSTVSVILRMIQSAKERGLTVVLDPAPAVDIPPEIWQYVDIITPNESEAAYYKDVAVKNKVVTLGSKGVYVTDGTKEITIPAVNVDVTDTTGAGDAFNGAFVSALSGGSDIFGAALYGNAAGALCASRRGAASAIPYRGEIEGLLYENL